MLLTDVVLTRERLGRRPLEVEGQVDPLWSKPMKDSSKVRCLKKRCLAYDKLYIALRSCGLGPTKSGSAYEWMAEGTWSTAP